MKVGQYGIRKLDDTEFNFVSNDYSRNKRVCVHVCAYILYIFREQYFFVPSILYTILHGPYYQTTYLSSIIYSQSRKSFEGSYKQSDFRYILFSGNATAVWEISPPARAALEDYLQQNKSFYIPLIFSWEITRYTCVYGTICT